MKSGVGVGALGPVCGQSSVLKPHGSFDSPSGKIGVIGGNSRPLCSALVAPNIDLSASNSAICTAKSPSGGPSIAAKAVSSDALESLNYL